jgi:hypothetical protein
LLQVDYQVQMESWGPFADDLTAIATLDTKTSSFFDHRDPKMVKWIGERKLST